MSERIKWNFATQVSGGPTVSAAATISDVDAYNKFDISLPDATSTNVNLTSATDVISLLVINPKAPDEDLTYALGTEDVKLDGPHVLIGAGAVSLLGGATSLTFTNGTGADAVIEILIGRDSTPP